MLRIFTICAVILVYVRTSKCVSSKADFGDEEITSVSTNSSTIEDDDVEVKHTIVVSTKLKNNNRKGIHSASEGDLGTVSHNVGRAGTSKKEDTDDVPIVNGYKAVETTHIRTPDTRHKTTVYPESVVINRNIRDEYDIYPDVATNPNQWKPSSYYNNINWWNPDNARTSNSFDRRNDRRFDQKPRTLHRKITDDGMREFYCRKCQELTNGQGYKGCLQQRSVPWTVTSTTPKIKIDGKLMKLN